MHLAMVREDLNNGDTEVAIYVGGFRFSVNDSEYSQSARQ
jgi:hypothetical protein